MEELKALREISQKHTVSKEKSPADVTLYTWGVPRRRDGRLDTGNIGSTITVTYNQEMALRHCHQTGHGSFFFTVMSASMAEQINKGAINSGENWTVRTAHLASYVFLEGSV